MDKIVSIIGIKTRQKTLDSIGYFRLKNKNYEVWDISGFIDVLKNRVSYSDEVDLKKSIVKIDNEEELIARVEKYNKNKNVCYRFYAIPEEGLEQRVKNRIKETGGNILTKNRFSGVPDENERGTVWKILGNVRYYKRCVENVFNKKVFPDYSFVSTSQNALDSLNASFKTRVCPIHSHDYDKYLTAKRDYQDIKHGAVFLSSNIPDHVEVTANLGEGVIDRNKYYKSIKSFFKYLEEERGISDIVVAEHPNADLNKVSKYWREYEVFKNETAKKILESRYVISQGGNSTLIGVMANKPILMISNKEMIKNDLSDFCQQYSKRLGIEMSVVNEDGIVSFGGFSKKDEYKKIMEEYIKEPGTPDVNSFDYMYEKVIGGE